MDKKEIDILDILIILAKHKKFIIITTLIVSIAAVIYVLVIPEIWQSSAVIQPIIDQENVDFGGSFFNSLGAQILNTGNINTDMLSIINSRFFLEDVMRKFKLKKFYQITEEDTLTANFLCLKKMRQDMISTGQDMETGLITISVQTKDRFLSPKIANYIAKKLDTYNRRIRMTKGKENRMFLYDRIVEVDSKIEELSYQIRLFQEKNKILELENQIKLQIETYVNLVSKYIENSIELDVKNNIYKNDASILTKDLEIRQKNLSDYINELEESNKGMLPDYFIEFHRVPKKIQEYALLEIEFEIQQTAYKYLMPQYEAAKLQELKDTPSIQIIDKAIPAGQRIKPKRAITCIISFILALVISSSFVIFKSVTYNYINKNDNHEKWDIVLKHIFKR